MLFLTLVSFALKETIRSFIIPFKAKDGAAKFAAPLLALFVLSKNRLNCKLPSMELECGIQQGNSIDLYVEVRSGTELDIGFMEVSVENYFMIRSIIRVGIYISLKAA